MSVRPAGAPRRGPRLDLVAHPFTQPDSRLVLRRPGEYGPLQLGLAEYERPLTSCLALDALAVVGDGGGEVSDWDATPDCLRAANGASIVPADPATWSITLPAGCSLRMGLVEPPVLGPAAGEAATAVAGQRVAWRAEGADVRQVLGPDGHALTITAGLLADARVLVQVGDLQAPGSLHGRPHAELADAAAAGWAAWFERRPAVRPDLAGMADLAWWVLAANRIRLGGNGPSIIAPSKLGYVAAWQWDSYFIAAGLRHGDPEEAWRQVAFFLEHALPDGQLPDVVSDRGAIYRVGDLPPDEIGTDPPDVPVTKPPLAAWVVWLVHEALGDPDRVAWALPRLRALQDWWATRSDLDGDGLSEYLHRYSSGLDDSPLFDRGVPAETPDLNAYLAVADDRMGRMAVLLGQTDDATAFDASARRRVDALVSRRWDPARRRFRAMATDREMDVLTPFNLMPLLTGRLAPPVVAALVETLTEPGRLWTRWPLATVAADEATFDPDRMWRGPVWLNVNRLIVDGLRSSGREDIARELAERSLDLVVTSGGPYEHWNPLTGRPAASATSAFAWSAACFVDLAVLVSGATGR